VVVNGHRDVAALDAVVADIAAAGGRAVACVADVADPQAAEGLVARAIEAFGRLDVVVSNVGIRRVKPLLEVSLDEWNATMAVNLTSAFVLARAALPGMIERGYGRLIHLSGLPAYTGRYGGKVPALASKTGLHGLAKGIADEYGHAGVTANVVAPGMIDTARDWAQYPNVDADSRRRQIPVGRLGTCADVALACVYLASEAGAFVNGQTLHLNGGEVMF
jgi:3-oxoacyl-[acyl-carrier protein] reductase